MARGKVRVLERDQLRAADVVLPLPLTLTLTLTLTYQLRAADVVELVQRAEAAVPTGSNSVAA